MREKRKEKAAGQAEFPFSTSSRHCTAINFRPLSMPLPWLILLGHCTLPSLGSLGHCTPPILSLLGRHTLPLLSLLGCHTLPLLILGHCTQPLLRILGLYPAILRLPCGYWYPSSHHARVPQAPQTHELTTLVNMLLTLYTSIPLYTVTTTCGPPVTGTITGALPYRIDRVIGPHLLILLGLCTLPIAATIATGTLY